MAYVIKNKRNGKTVKDAITGKPMFFDDKEHASYFAVQMERSSIIDATAFNSVRPSKYEVHVVSA